ncbi:VQ motif-containing protein 10-like [Solanum tuberosum]|uniref:Avr9/Cf-9 rapidly elicited protein 169 n=1 Tax=Solanum tuberosum TaxID=4113 RepID=M1CN71_SOLTU|nr:PREDICTED: VQ motif-containing protein 10-like [Solanum tuberosum]
MSNIPVKIVIINTQYIETDASSFKSVVQKLTGKNSTVAVESAFSPPPPLPVAAPYNGCGHGSSNYWEDQNVGPSLGRLKSFNEFDKLFKELPTLDDLLRLYSDEIQQ